MKQHDFEMASQLADLNAMDRFARNYNPDMLRRARENLDLSLDQAAEFFDFSSDRLDKFERGELQATKIQLHRIAEKYETSELIFYLKKLPIDKSKDMMANFQIAKEPVSELERTRLRIYIKKLLVRHEILKDLVNDLNEKPFVDFIQLINLNDTIGCAATKIIERFDLDQIPNYYRDKIQRRTLYQEIRKRCEDNRLFVFMAGYFETGNYKLGSHVFSGISIADKEAPIVVINSNESECERAFTLFHGLTRICLGSDEIWRNSSRSNTTHNGIGTKRLCDHVANEIFSTAQFQCAGDCSQKNRRQRRGNGKGESAYFIAKRASVGDPLIKLVKRGVESGDLRYTDAAKVLGVRMSGVDKVLMQV